ncbi:HNH endonuclease [Candidatus Peregrinibacteria bacterium]|nr:HNH endonuclease [Candidatus Peregrinibacteria bacterium]
MKNIEALSDQNLYQLCQAYGARALEWRRKFIGLLPEVNRRKLYVRKGFGSIFEFAKKLAGLSEDQVRLALNLEKRFYEMPNLKNLLVNGEVSMNKLARVVSIASVENQEFLAEQVRNLSQGAVETFVRDEKWERKEANCGVEDVSNMCSDEAVGKNQNGLFEPENGDKSLRAQTLNELNLSAEVQAKLLNLQNKGFDINQLILELLEKREDEIAEKKEQIRRKVLQKEEEKAEKAEIIDEYSLEPVKFQSRYISKPVRKIIREEFGTKCSVKNCQKTSVQIHHILSFAIGKTNDPKLLVPLCKEHHELQHGVNWKYREVRAEAYG